MTNQEEFNKIMQIVGTDEYAVDNDFINRHVKKFNFARNMMYITLFVEGVFFCIVRRILGRDSGISSSLTLIIMIALLISMLKYMKQKKIITNELLGSIHRECRPDVSVSKYMSFVSMVLKKQVLWNTVQYHFGCALYRHGRIHKANACLRLMQESSETATGMMLAEHLKMLIALYYKDYDTVMACAGEAGVLYPKAVHNNFVQKIYGDMQRAGAYASCMKNNDYNQAISTIQVPSTNSLDELTKHYYLYLAAAEQQDFANAENYRNYVRMNAGTTWYGQAVEDGFVPVEKPAEYPGFYMTPEQLSKPRKIDRSRIKYLLIGVALVILSYIIDKRI